MKFVYAKELSDPTGYPSVKRAAVVPFTIINGDLHFMFGVDKQSGDITDAGGGRKFEKNEPLIKTGFREWGEEVRRVFGNRHDDYNSADLFISAINERRKKCVIFYPVEPREVAEVQQKFELTRGLPEFSNRAFNELSKIVWYTVPQLRDLISRKGKMWRELKPFYRELTTSMDFYDLIRGSYNFHFRLREMN